MRGRTHFLPSDVPIYSTDYTNPASCRRARRCVSALRYSSATTLPLSLSLSGMNHCGRPLTTLSMDLWEVHCKWGTCAVAHTSIHLGSMGVPITAGPLDEYVSLVRDRNLVLILRRTCVCLVDLILSVVCRVHKLSRTSNCYCICGIPPLVVAC